MDAVMQSGHLDDEQLERYAMGNMPNAELAPVEEHLLLCPRCQDAVAATEAYLGAMRAAAAEIRHEEKRPLWAFLPKPAWAGALATLALMVLAGTLWWAPGDGAPVAVMLASTRGAGDSAFVPAPAGRPLALSVDAGELPASGGYRLEVVDEGGRRVWEGPAAPSGATLNAALPRLHSGRYYVRLYSPARELLREYGVESR